MSAPLPVLLARLANILESARVEAKQEAMGLTRIKEVDDLNTLRVIESAQELLEVIRDGV